MSRLKVGVIGTGFISREHMRAYARHAGTQLYGVCGSNEERAKQVAAEFGITKVYADYRELLADPQLDAVSVCTWNSTHAAISMAALDAGKHVLVEKPLCTTVEDALAIEAAERASSAHLQIGYVRRHADYTNVLKRFIDNGDLGEIYYAKASQLRVIGNPGGCYADIAKSGGGPLIDIGVHVIDLCWYLMGRPKVRSVSGNTYSKLGNRAHIENLTRYRAFDCDPGRNTIEDMANVVIRFANGASLLVDVSYSLHAKKSETIIRLHGDKGGAELEPEFVIATEKYNTLLNVTPQITHAAFDFTNAFQNQIDHFVACCLKQEQPISPVSDGVEMMKILCGIYKSAEKGSEVSF